MKPKYGKIKKRKASRSVLREDKVVGVLCMYVRYCREAQAGRTFPGTKMRLCTGKVLRIITDSTVAAPGGLDKWKCAAYALTAQHSTAQHSTARAESGSFSCAEIEKYVKILIRRLR